MGQRGRPINESKQLALVMGDHTYTGKRCRKCAATLRYVKGGNCVMCARRLAEHQRRSLEKSDDACDLDDLLGLGKTVSEGDWHTTGTPRIGHLCQDEAIDPPSDFQVWNTGTPRIPHCADENRVGERDMNNTEGEGYLHEENRQFSACQCDSPENPKADQGVKAGTDAENLGVPVNQNYFDAEMQAALREDAEKLSQITGEAHEVSFPAEPPTIRYFCHPESGCIWLQGLEDAYPTDPLVEEITEGTFRDLQAEGWSFNQDDGLDDILG